MKQDSLLFTRSPPCTLKSTIQNYIDQQQQPRDKKQATERQSSRTMEMLSSNKSTKVISNQHLRFRHHCLLVLAMFGAIQIMPSLLGGHQKLATNVVVCQDFEDLTKQSALTTNGANGQSSMPHHTFQPINRQQQLRNAAAGASAIHQSTSSSKHSQRPVLSNRFATSSSSSSSAIGQQQQLVAQASNSAAVFSSPSAGVQQQVAPTVSVEGGGGVSNIEQLMKNALARTAQMNAAAAESRSDIIANAAIEQPSAQQQQQGRSQQLQPALVSLDKVADSSEVSAPGLGEDGDKQTTATATTNGHETVYSDQRFANLFARRNNGKKSRINPTEQVKAKPTLPSFIKSPPDPKQFNAASQNVQQEGGPRVAIAAVATGPSSSSQFASQRLQQQQNQSRINLANQQKKAAITSNSAAQANNKRANTLNGKPATNGASSSSNQKATAAKAGAPATAASKPTPVGNNPFNRSQSSSSNDPANVIAMARKRLLANNALESAKLKQQQQNKPASN